MVVTPAGAPGLESAVGHGIVDGQEGHPHHAIETQSGGFAVIGESAVESSAGERMTAYLLVTDAATNVIFKADVGQAHGAMAIMCCSFQTVSSRLEVRWILQTSPMPIHRAKSTSGPLFA